MCSLWATVSTSPGPVQGITLSKAVAVLMRSCQVVNNKQTTCSVNNKQHPRQHQPPRCLPSTLPQGSALSAQLRPTIPQLEPQQQWHNIINDKRAGEERAGEAQCMFFFLL